MLTYHRSLSGGTGLTWDGGGGWGRGEREGRGDKQQPMGLQGDGEEGQWESRHGTKWCEE